MKLLKRVPSGRSCLLGRTSCWLPAVTTDSCRCCHGSCWLLSLPVQLFLMLLQSFLLTCGGWRALGRGWRRLPSCGSWLLLLLLLLNRDSHLSRKDGTAARKKIFLAWVQYLLYSFLARHWIHLLPEKISQNHNRKDDPAKIQMECRWNSWRAKAVRTKRFWQVTQWTQNRTDQKMPARPVV